MELSVAQVAREHGRSERFVQMALKSGHLAGHRVVGRVVTIDDIAARAWDRSLGQGRRWVPDVRDAALDVLSSGQTRRLSSSERSRLKSRLRSISVPQLAHAMGGIGHWARYRGTPETRLPRIGPSALAAEELGLVSGQGWLTFVQVPNLDDFELEHDVILDGDGNLGVVCRDTLDERAARVLLDCYLLGDARQSEAAAAQLRRRCRDV